MVETKGEDLHPISHHTSFIRDNKFYIWGGIVSEASSDFKVYDIISNEWKTVRTTPDPKKSNMSLEEKPCCEIRDDHACFYDKDRDCMYIFGGYVNGDKANDLWKYDFLGSKWVLLHPGDYKKQIHGHTTTCCAVS